MVFGRKKKEAPAPMPPVPQPAAPSAGRASGSRSNAARQLTRESDRNVMRAQRDMQRERLRLEGEERRIAAEVKALGRQGRLPEARMLAKNLVQVRNAKQRTFQANGQLAAVGNQARMAAADAALVSALGNATDVMKNVSGAIDQNAQMAMLQEYDMHTEKMKTQQDMTDEVLDSVLGGEEVDDDADQVLNSVLDEIGLEVASDGVSAPAIKPAVPQQHAVAGQAQAQAGMESDQELMERLARLGGPS